MRRQTGAALIQSSTTLNRDPSGKRTQSRGEEGRIIVLFVRETRCTSEVNGASGGAITGRIHLEFKNVGLLREEKCKLRLAYAGLLRPKLKE